MRRKFNVGRRHGAAENAADLIDVDYQLTKKNPAAAMMATAGLRSQESDQTDSLQGLPDRQFD